MSSYALFKDGFVSNVVVWDGQGNIFDSFSPVEIKDSFMPDIGDAYVGSVLYPMPRDGYEYTFNSDSLEWEITTEGEEDKQRLLALQNIATAQAEYNRASDKITALQQQIDDEDYSGGDTATSIAADKATWVSYRKALRGYIATANGGAILPESPQG